jgi:hypothetical protein
MKRFLKIIGLVLLGVSLTLTAEITWAARYNFFLVTKQEALYRHFERTPINEFAGMDAEAYR